MIAGGVTLAGVGSSLLAEGATTAQAVKGVALEAGKTILEGVWRLVTLSNFAVFAILEGVSGRMFLSKRKYS